MEILERTQYYTLTIERDITEKLCTIMGFKIGTCLLQFNQLVDHYSVLISMLQTRRMYYKELLLARC